MQSLKIQLLYKSFSLIWVRFFLFFFLAINWIIVVTLATKLYYRLITACTCTVLLFCSTTGWLIRLTYTNFITFGKLCTTYCTLCSIYEKYSVLRHFINFFHDLMQHWRGLSKLAVKILLSWYDGTFWEINSFLCSYRSNKKGLIKQYRKLLTKLLLIKKYSKTCLFHLIIKRWSLL